MVMCAGSAIGGMGIREFLRTGARTLSELVTVGELTKERFSLDEMNVLIYHVWEASMLAEGEHGQECWLLLQHNLRTRGICGELFREDKNAKRRLDDAELCHLFQRLRQTSCEVTRHVKREWAVVAQQLRLHCIVV